MDGCGARVITGVESDLRLLKRGICYKRGYKEATLYKVARSSGSRRGEASSKIVGESEGGIEDNEGGKERANPKKKERKVEAGRESSEESQERSPKKASTGWGCGG